jgi:Fe-S-cluster-containing dehydrogenase component
MKSWHVIIDVASCEDCNNCLLACKDEHLNNAWPGYTQPQPRHGHRWIDVIRGERGQYPQVDVAYLPTMCMHCQDAPCMKANAGAVYQRPDGIVMIDPNKAKGRRDLVNSCPYHMIWWNEAENAPQKCTFCAHLVDDGWKQTRCSQACPTGTLRMEYMDDAEFARLVEKEGLEALHPEYATRPRVYYKNLYRFTKCFIAGSVAATAGDTTDCVAGARVTLSQANTKIGEAVTDIYGDFRFDKLEPGGRDYVVEIRTADSAKRTLSVEVLNESLNLGTIFITPELAESAAR